MLINGVKIYALKKLGSAGFILCLSLILVAVSLSNKHFHQKQYQSNLQQLDSLKSATKTLLADMATSESVLMMWNGHLNKIYGKGLTGLDIEAAKGIIETIVPKGFTNIQVGFTDSERRTDLTQSDYVAVQYSLITIDFDTGSDVDVLKFIDSLNTQLRGVVTITDLGMTLDKDHLRVQMKILWQGLIDVRADKIK